MTPAFLFVDSRLWLFLLLSVPVREPIPGYARVIDEGTGKAILFAPVSPHPRIKADALAATARLRCSFPQAGRYTVQVWS